MFLGKVRKSGGGGAKGRWEEGRRGERSGVNGGKGRRGRGDGRRRGLNI